jgi:hypothetical protein
LHRVDYASRKRTLGIRDPDAIAGFNFGFLIHFVCLFQLGYPKRADKITEASA